MLQTMHKKTQQRFHDSAGRYDLFASLHRGIADKLLIQVSSAAAPLSILDVGCGTGYLTGLLKKRFPQSRIMGFDFAQGMLKQAAAKYQGIDWILGDSHHLPFSDDIFNLVVSNLAYQWAEDLSLAFAEAYRVLSADGRLILTLFGYHTCQELFQCLQEVKAGVLQFRRLPNQDQVREALIAAKVHNYQIDSEVLKMGFKDMQELMVWLKSIGANNLLREGYVGPETISRAAAIYQSRFSLSHGIVATFEVIKINVKK